MDNIKQVIEERGSNYGQFKDHAHLSQELKGCMQRHAEYKYLSTEMRESLEMIQHKVARVINGNQNHLDSWIDIQGYAKLISDGLI